ncbi:RNA polymerase factor sigma-54 [Planomicrobium sp. CPCC 101110]|uniref:RNA polymerase factor sigma-54 n=1 Tax=Planomicrobium sp. CPCC 101110 TaxID=2599619 RepID=UPI0011B6E534|nr:RNA polymerase factor sigma-54 [Planomicrobium sp. CPCC 101110]TWT25345.1 RNA polymerase factor sigma-54 [Planomicrobium sp. CPCC 101110]
MELVLQQKQELHLIMTFKLRQAIELLQYSTYDLYKFIKEQQEENPLIELEERKHEVVYEERSFGKSHFGKLTNQAFELKTNDGPTMRDQLLEQAKFIYRDIHDQKVIAYLIYNLDDNGYLSFNADGPEVYGEFTEEEIDRGIRLLQALGLKGIGARCLKECLLLQISEEYPDKKQAECLIQNYLQLLADRKWNELALRMNISLAKIKEIHDFILTLNPKPCAHISDFSAQYVNPDIIVESKPNGLSFGLNDSYLPAIRFNHSYSGMLDKKDETSKYINGQFANYQWLLNSIEQRRQTILKIVSVIIKKQASFFADGFISLKPLTLKEVAEEIGMHESTVSRATMNKVIQTPKGTFELRIFFASGLETANGPDISQTKVKMLLKSMIEKEDKSKPLSDQKITDLFNGEKGISISRRTVTKYRKEMRIPSSSSRKEIKI